VRFRSAILALACAGCAALGADRPAVPYPGDWPPVAARPDCHFADGTYGFRSIDRTATPITIPLFYIAESPRAEPARASLRFDEQAGEIVARLGDDAAETIRVPARCVEGHLLIDQETSGTEGDLPWVRKGISEIWSIGNGQWVAYSSWGYRTCLMFCVGSAPIEERRWSRFARSK
jgi:hypothetical protein